MRVLLLFSLTIIFVLAGNQSHCQSISRQSISSFGTTGSIGGIYLDQTVGQPYDTKTYQQNDFRLNPGFQQFYALKQEVQLTGNMSAMEIFPNPARDEIFIRSTIPAKDVRITIVDSNGRVLFENTYDDFLQERIACGRWAPGLYAVTFHGNHSKSYVSTRMLIIQ
jgi:hypothetical protein